MKVGDFVRSKANDHYGLVTAVTSDVFFSWAHVLWQGIACDTTWERIDDLVSGVENELTITRVGQ